MGGLGGEVRPHGSGSSLQELAKDLEAKSGLKAAVVAAGAQMLQLRGDGEGDEAPDAAGSCLQVQLAQVDLDWSRLLADVPAAQTALQQVRTTPPITGFQLSWFHPGHFGVLSAGWRRWASRGRCGTCRPGWTRLRPDWRSFSVRPDPAGRS